MPLRYATLVVIEIKGRALRKVLASVGLASLKGALTFPLGQQAMVFLQ